MIANAKRVVQFLIMPVLVTLSSEKKNSNTLQD